MSMLKFKMQLGNIKSNFRKGNVKSFIKKGINSLNFIGK